ncbi:leucyl aminopeptidase [Methylopila turkensis]|uniref:Probable cytosol aminopeptidase n=1 Tax=Methylopila turkensis TaxID=1437816 RepID=A0A9W6JQ60_9HYPH|nr:leucyl aminopeptidase [Methylopila turkensis]GLK79955.1 putative cytosol aminopeptidase [Methylopila turkensis]
MAKSADAPSGALKIAFQKPDADVSGVVVALAGPDLAFGPATTAAVAPARDALGRAAAAERFKAAQGSGFELLAPALDGVERLIVVGLGDGKEPTDWVKLGGQIRGRVASGATEVTVIAETAEGALAAEAVADIALGVRLRDYAFDVYKTKKKDDERGRLAKVTFAVGDESAAKKAWKLKEGLAEGVELARTLVNEPPNVLTPTEFAKRAAALEKLGVEVEILGEKELRKAGFGALLAVGQGSVQESKVAIMRWNGAKDKAAQPVAFVGKGVIFDTGGISIKPSASMEDMKGDMAGAACVVGLMHALASRKAKVNVIGAIGCVENMPDGGAYRPGDIITGLSGQTIEIINTDAEGRLVLADVLWHVQDRFKPKFMVDLATLTGAILVALGVDNAGLFSNDDELSERLYKTGLATGEKVWRMPMGPEFDKLIDSRFADMKQTGGRHGGSITAAQFLKRHVNDTPWAHLDIAGTGMGSPASDINRSWGSGWGVRLLDRLVKDYYEE